MILFPDYPISPKRALAYLIIPIYNFWGIWHTFATIADYFKDETEPTITHAGERLYLWVPYLYVALIVSNVIGRVALRWGDIAPRVVVASTICNVFLIVVWLQITRIIFSGINNLNSIK